MATIQVPDPDQPWKVGDLVTVHLRVGGANGNDYVLEAADVVRQDYVEQIHADYHRQLEEQGASLAKHVDEVRAGLIAERDQLVEQLQARNVATLEQLQSAQAELAQLQAALTKSVGGPVITSAGVT